MNFPSCALDATLMKQTVSDHKSADYMAPYTVFAVCLVGCRFKRLQQVP